MNEDIYFEEKAEELRNKIADFKIRNSGITFDDIDKIIYLTLKEVARDQRDACITSINTYREAINRSTWNDLYYSGIDRVIQKAQIKGAKK
jgi:hypothetical protein